MRLCKLIIPALLTTLVMAFAAVSDVSAQGKEPWADSLYNFALESREESLQTLLDNLGYDIDVANDELGIEVFCGPEGLNTGTMILEVAGSAVYATSGYYAAGDTSVFYQLFGPSNVPGDSVQFTFSGVDSIGFYMKPQLPGEDNTWLTETALNWDGFDHAWVFATGTPHEYLVCFEDLPDGGDEDYQDLVIKIRFANEAPDITLADFSTTLCAPDSICFDILVTDANCQGDSLWLEMLSGNGVFTPVSGVGSIAATHCFLPTDSGAYTFVFEAEDILGAVDVDTITIYVDLGSAPVVSLPDTSFFLCDPAELCLPVSILDQDCDIVSVTTNVGTYTGTLSDFDQIARLNALGATVTQIGGGAPGTILTQASDFVSPVNSQSGVTVAMPEFAFASHIVNTGSFPAGIGPVYASGQLVGAPTDLTFTLPGAGGPDGGSGDGSVDFQLNNYVVVGFPQEITTCNGANTDFIVFTNTATTGVAEVKFERGGAVVHTMALTIPGGTAGSGMGGVTLDLPDGITFDAVRVTCTSGTFEVDGFAGRTLPSTTTSDICFDADTSGLYELIVTATDSCGNVGADTTLVSVDINSAPEINAGSDLALYQCELSEVCFGVAASDPDGNLSDVSLISGPGTLSGGQVCFTPTAAGVNTFVVRATDDCGLMAYDTVVVTVDLNDPPVAVNPQPVTVFQCEPTELCHTFTASDPNGGTLVWTHLAGVGSVSPGGEFCFTPTVSGSYTGTVAVTDSCGAADTVSISYNITINSAPSAIDPAGPFAMSQCVADEICYQFGANDADGGALIWSLASGVGSLTPTGNWCFTPTASGNYSATVIVTDSCGAADTTSLTYEITINDAPTVAFGNDSTLLLCDPQEVCQDYTVSDPQGLSGLTETMLSGFGSIDTAGNQICFTPTTTGVFEFVVEVTDDCGATDTDTVVVDVTFGDIASIDCPEGPVDVSLCSVDDVCQQLLITPAGAGVTTSFGTYAAGELCFTADTSGTYVIEVIADALCGADTCEITFNVDIGQAAQISCPSPQAMFICEADTICVPVGVMGTDLTTTVSPIGYYQGGNVCFVADTSGHYEIELIATTPCGSDTCVIAADVTINTAPVATDPTSPVDTFLCTADQICYQFTATDVDGGDLIWSRLSGKGTVTDGGLWCFNAAASGSFTVDAEVVDSCGATDTVSLTYNVSINREPTITLGNDTTIFLCDLGTVCLPLVVTDADDNIDIVEILFGDASATLTATELCFDPSAAGTYQFIVGVTDECGDSDIDTINVEIGENLPPVVDAGADLTEFQCTPTEICWSVGATDPDGNLMTVELIEGPGTFDGSQICFTPTGTSNYEFVLKATDACGEESYDTVAVYYTLNTAPVADAGADQILFQCDPTEICWPASCTDADGNLAECILLEGPGTYDGSDICFTPSISGVYTFVLGAEDACGLTDADTAVISVTVNSAPVCTVPNDTMIFQCVASEVCLPTFGTDADDNLVACQIISGPGALVNGEWCYTPVSDQTVTVTLHCEDACGAVCETSFTVEFDINGPPEVAFGNDTTVFLCASDEICLPYMASDNDDPRPTTLTLVSGPGTLDEANSQVCFTPATTGSYEFVVSIEDECGVTDVDTINVDVSLNSAPVADAGPDQTTFVCDSLAEICWPASCSDVDGNLADCLFNGPGTYDGSNICFAPAISGTYVFTLRAEDECGLIHIDTVQVDVTINSTPTIALDADSSLLLCAPQEICVNYTVSDADGLGGLVEAMVSGYGTIDTLNNQICFTPTLKRTPVGYEFIVSVTDSCGAVGYDTVMVQVTFGDQAVIDCPSDPIDVSLCAAEQVCFALPISPVGATVTTDFGTYANGELCFMADTSGVYTITVDASAECGDDQCVLTFNVDIGQAAEISCPVPQTRFICEAGDVCIPISVMTPGATVTVTPIGSYDAGNICFPADTSGYYELKVVATTTCGSDSCYVYADITINSAPVANEPASAVVDTFLCAADQICYQFTATDVDGGDLIWSRLSGNGTVTDGGLWCFNAATGGNFTVDAEVVDSCGAADTVSLTYTVTLNSAPQAALGNDTTLFLCATEELCLPYSVIDTDGNAVLEELTFGTGTIDTVANQVCFTPDDTGGTYEFAVTVTDSCGAESQDAIVVTVQMNQAPVVTAVDDFSVFQCEAAEICWTVLVTDPDSNLDEVSVTPSGAAYSNDQVCFTPDTAGVYTLVVTATDICGLSSSDTVLVTVDYNSPPICEVPNDTTFFQCAPSQVSLPVTGSDPDNNLDHCEIITGPGSLADGIWTYTPTVDQSATVKVMCIDDCGVICEDSFTVDFQLNAKPVVDAGADTSVFLCEPEEICWPVNVTDEDNNLQLVELITGVGTYSAGEICFTPGAGDATYQFIVQATDECGAEGYDTVLVEVIFNSPPTLAPPPDFIAYLDAADEVCFDVNPGDPDDNLATVLVGPIGTYLPGTEQVCFFADTSGEYCMVLTATDICGDQTIDTVCVTIQIDECIHVQIEKTHNSYQGLVETVNVFLNGSGKELGGYDLLLAYDVSALTVSNVLPGQAILDCGWEYFTYRHGATGNCAGCPTGLLRITAIAETNNGANHPGCFLQDQIGPLTTVEFLVSSDATLECQYAPVEFFWMDCGDNTFSSRDGDTLWVSRNVFSFEMTTMTDYSWGFPGKYGAPDPCLVGGGPGKPAPIRCVDFTNGGVDIACADSIDARADINLNEIPFEVADAVLFSNYFVYGLGVFHINLEGQIAASDVNADGITLSVADLVYLIRVIVGDATPLPKATPEGGLTATLAVEGDVLSIAQSSAEIGALALVLEGEAKPNLHPDAEHMQMAANFDGENTHVLVFDINGEAWLEPGNVLILDGARVVKSVDAGSFAGQVMQTQVNDVPRYWSLSQNYPNPFNPKTVIEFTLKEVTDWELTVFNILGQEVSQFSGTNAVGAVKVTWDAAEYSSGVYLYRLEAGDFTASRKMVLLK